MLIGSRGQRFTTNFRAKSDVYVAIDPNDDEDDMQREFDLYTCSADLAPSRVGDPGMRSSSHPKSPADSRRG